MCELHLKFLSPLNQTFNLIFVVGYNYTFLAVHQTLINLNNDHLIKLNNDFFFFFWGPGLKPQETRIHT